MNSAMKKPSLAIHQQVNQGGPQFYTKVGENSKDQLGWRDFTKFVTSAQAQSARPFKDDSAIRS